MNAIPTGSLGMCDSCGKRHFLFLVRMDSSLGSFSVCEGCLPVPVRRW